ncbi:fat storage-inducing transmembrane protein 2 [Xiphophorus maculatus]|uniref:Fat storage inducing transmembrane protein 2 n=1 Tax=Xiphophorus maculatus TaxID=8083 RepID=M3ZG59_XIPMA|nr:fat storage-inducing transmembrane protein 2 [Xiphophorus maculatus]
MAAMDVIVERLMSVWRIPAVRQSFPWLFLFMSLLGSILKELDLVPQSYFSSSKNFVNLYFVKVSWGWTLLLLTPFLLFSSSDNQSRSALFKRLLALAVATAVWYVCTGTFLYIEDVTGSCFDSKTASIANEFTSKAACRRAGFHWQGHDISGHSFILSYSSLLIMEEISAMTVLKKVRLHRTLLNLLYLALNLIVATWVWMFACTSVYFHNPQDKLLGTACGLLGWYLTYRYWYQKPFSPGLPPQRQEKEQKQRA